MADFFDIPVFYFINHNMSNQFFNFLMPVMSRFGGGELYFLLGILLLFSRKKELKYLGILLLASLTISYNITYLLKVLTARPRPFMTLPDVILLGAMEKSYSFPSNHAMTAFIVASLLGYHFKKYITFYLLAAIISFSRIYIGVHYPSDVLAGAIIGCLIGWFLVKINRSLVSSQ